MKIPPNRNRWQRLSAVLAGFCLAATLAACGAASKGLEAETAKQFQAKVLTITESAAGSDHAGALASLDALRAELEAAASNGQVSFARHQSIKGAIDAVRVDLVAAQAAAEAPTPSPADIPAPAPPADQGKGDEGSDKGSNDRGRDNGRGKGDD